MDDARDIVLREGQDISLIKGDGIAIALLNHNTDKIHLLESRDHLYENKTFWHYILPPILAIWLNLYFDTGWGWAILWGFVLTGLIVVPVTSLVLLPLARSRLDKELLPILRRMFYKDR